LLFADANQLDGAVNRWQGRLLDAAPLVSGGGRPRVGIGCNSTYIGYKEWAELGVGGGVWGLKIGRLGCAGAEFAGRELAWAEPKKDGKITAGAPRYNLR
jgi:hypothetical protein